MANDMALSSSSGAVPAGVDDHGSPQISLSLVFAIISDVDALPAQEVRLFKMFSICLPLFYVSSILLIVIMCFHYMSENEYSYNY